MKKMLAELKDLRNQLTVACNERQQAMKESNALKTDLKGRISQMEEMKQLLEQLQTVNKLSPSYSQCVLRGLDFCISSMHRSPQVHEMQFKTFKINRTK